MKKPIYTVNSAKNSDYNILKKIALNTGGKYIDLKRGPNIRIEELPFRYIPQDQEEDISEMFCTNSILTLAFQIFPLLYNQMNFF